MMDAAVVAERAGEFRAHPLGFFYLQDSVGEGISHRVHVWLPEGPDRPENDRHQHSFDIHSIIRLGRMRSELFRFVEVAGGGETEFLVAYGKADSALSPTGRSGRLETMTMFESSAGDRYFLEAGTVHRVAVIERPCVTFLKTVERGAPIFSYGRDEKEAPFDRRLVSSAERDRIAALLSSVG
jgi:hypothetical protein